MDFNYLTFLYYGVLFVFVAFFVLCCVLIVTTAPYPSVNRAKEENYFVDPVSGKKHEFPTLSEACSLNLSVIVPAYNEEKRLPPMLNECLGYLQSRPPRFKYEVIVVSDGSTDKTVEIASEYAKKYGSDTVRVLNLITNRGKGGAVRLGILSARGATILFADADGATQFSELSKLEASLNLIIGADYATNPAEVSTKPAIVCGSRAHLEKDAIANRSYFRTFLMYGFHFLVWLLAVRSLRDTQCGFKLLTREAAKICFESMHVERWAFDVELLYIAERLKMPISEIAVKWTEIEGSKVVPVWSWLQMGKDLILIWLRYRLGAWKLAKRQE